MKEHMDVPIDTSNMSEQELQFHYFKMHDADGNNKLDGCELVKSLIHWHGKHLLNALFSCNRIWIGVDQYIWLHIFDHKNCITQDVVLGYLRADPFFFNVNFATNLIVNTSIKWFSIIESYPANRI